MSVASRDLLFDAAVNRALLYARRLGVPLGDSAALKGGLELWYLKTRFAYRVPLKDVLGALERYPGEGQWRGGASGSWQPHPARSN